MADIFREQLAKTSALINAKGDELLLWFNPNLVAERPTRGWCMTRADSAVYVVAAYVAFVFFGSIFMKFKKTPFTFHRRIQYLYNPVQVIVCSWMCLEAVRQVYNLPEAKLLGNAYDAQRTSIAKVLWAFYVSKILDFLDTVFIILSQNWRQLSFLHVYHHISIFLTYWVIINAGYDGDIYLTIVLNTFVHVCMYMYYMITSLNLLDPEARAVRQYQDAKLFFTNKSTKNPAAIAEAESDINKRKRARLGVQYSPSWKKFITMLQMVQFMCMNGQAIYSIYVLKGESYPVRILWYYLFYIQSLFWLFFNFFVRSYCGGSSKKVKKN